MFLHCLCENEYAIQIDADYTFRDQVLEYLVHHSLKGGRTIGETEELTRGLKSPQFVQKAAFHSSPSLMRTLLYPHQTSSLVKYHMPWSQLMRLEMSGSGYTFFTVFTFSALWSWTNHRALSFFLMKNTRAAIRDLDRCIRPDARFSSMKASNSICSFRESRYTLVEEVFTPSSNSIA